MPTPFARKDNNPIRKIMPFAPPHPSPSLNEAVLGEVAGDDPTRLMIAEAIKATRLAAEKSRNAAVAIFADTSLPEGGQHMQADAVSFRVTHAALPICDRARQNAETELTALRKKTAGPPPDTSISGHMLASELRQLLASQTGKARLDMIAKSLAEGDDSLAAAALHASRFLCGLDGNDQQAWTTCNDPGNS
jgi:hypothetical protein